MTKENLTRIIFNSAVTVKQRREGAQVEDMELDRDVTNQGQAEQSMGEWREGGAREKPGAGGARWATKVQPGRCPTAEFREGEAKVEVLMMTPGG